MCSVVSTLAGGGPTAAGFTSFADGSGVQAGFFYPAGVLVDASGNVLIADRTNHRIRRMTPSGGTSMHLCTQLQLQNARRLCTQTMFIDVLSYSRVRARVRVRVRVRVCV